jgi:DNA repair exonuclease SbcCD ATPase subunit
MNIVPPSTNPSNVDPNGTPPVHGTNPQLQGNKDTSIEDLQRQLAELQAKNAEFLADNQKYREERRLQNEAAKAAEQQRLKEQGEFKQLAEQSAARVKELEPIQERYEQLSGLLKDQIKAQIKDWPKEVKDLLPGDDTPIEVRYQQAQKLQALADKVADQAQTQQRASLPGNRPGPQPNQNSELSRDQQKQEFRLRRARSGQYGL